MAPYIICIDGNIAAGKSTILNELTRKGYTVYREELRDWMWVLDRCYSDSKRWAFTLQIAALNSMASQKKIIDKLKDPIIFVERCPVSTIVFTNTWHAKGCLTDEEFCLIQKLYDLLSWTPNLTIMVTSDIETCFKRMNNRGRPCEKSLSIDHLSEVHNQYKKLYADRKDVLFFEPKDDTVTIVTDRIEQILKDVVNKL